MIPTSTQQCEINWKEQNENFGLDVSTKNGKIFDYEFDIRYDCVMTKEKPSCGLVLHVYKGNVRLFFKLGESIEYLTKQAELFLEKEASRFACFYDKKVEQKKNDRELIKKTILDEYKNGNIVVSTHDGIKGMPLKEFVKQPVEGILYDLNRNEMVILTFIEDPKWVNDYAAAQVIRELKSQLDVLTSKKD